MITPKQMLVAGAVLIVAAALFAVRKEDSGHPGRKQLPTFNMVGGYLDPSEVLEGLSNVPPPPPAGSPGFQRDEQARKIALSLNDPARYAQAVSDSNRGVPETLRSFSCALGTDISDHTTPHLAHLLNRLRIDTRHEVGPLRDRYKRIRPYLQYKTRTCSPADEALVEDQGSYPSARSAVGWSFALVLAEINPARSSVILQRGRDFGQSRLICDAQWQSDVDAGEQVGTLVVARLRRDKTFLADLQSAKVEVAHVLATTAKPPAGCGKMAIAAR